MFEAQHAPNASSLWGLQHPSSPHLLYVFGLNFAVVERQARYPPLLYFFHR